jgi:hypothetical protein
MQEFGLGYSQSYPQQPGREKLLSRQAIKRISKESL